MKKLGTILGNKNRNEPEIAMELQALITILGRVKNNSHTDIADDLDFTPDEEDACPYRRNSLSRNYLVRFEHRNSKYLNPHFKTLGCFYYIGTSNYKNTLGRLPSWILDVCCSIISFDLGLRLNRDDSVIDLRTFSAPSV